MRKAAPAAPEDLVEATQAAAARAIPAGGSFDEVLVASRPRLFRAALLMLGAREDAEDVTQKALLRALGGRERFRAESEVYTWLYRILVNVCKDRYRARSRAARWLQPMAEDTPEPAAPGPSSEERLAGAERERRLQAALASLEPRWREVLVLRHYQELSYEQIAEVLKCPVGTVRSRLSTARERLRLAFAAAAGTPAEEGGD